MTLENMLRQQLNNKGDGNALALTHDGWTIALNTDQRDTLSCALKELTLDRATPIREELRAWAQRIADSATGLMEPLRLIEVDAPLGKAILRSDAPSQRDGKALYYELALERTTRTRATLHRYAGQFGERREAVPFVLTHDAVVKLVTDIVGGN